MSFVLVLITLMFAADVLWWIWSDAQLRPTRHPRRWRMVVGAFMLFQLGSLILMLGGRMLGQRIEMAFPSVLLVGVFLWHFILLPVFTVWMGVGALIAGIRWLRRRRLSVDEPHNPAAGLTRRELLRTATAIAPPVATTILTGASFAQLSDFRIRKMSLRYPNLPPDLDGLRIAHVSDIHVGRFTTERILRKIVQTTNELRSDLVLLTGDLINFALSDLSGALDGVRSMDGGRGVYMVQGNHDLFEGREAFNGRVRAAGVPLLVNEVALVSVRGHPIQLLGLQWGPGRADLGVEQSMMQLVPQLEPEAFPILLAHHPHAFDWAAEAGIPLTLAGHTHGGQIMPLGVGFGPLMYRYWSGLYEKDASKLVVSNGVGNWFPLRINAPAEIVEITLHRG